MLFVNVDIRFRYPPRCLDVPNRNKVIVLVTRHAEEHRTVRLFFHRKSRE